MTDAAPTAKAARTHPVYRLTLWLCGWFARLYLHCRWEGVENIPAEGPVILAANHESFLDPFLVARAATRRVEFLALRKLYDKSLVRWFLVRLHTIPVDSEGSPYGVKAAVQRLRAGGAIGIFPEGERTRTGEVQEFKDGLGLLAVAGKATIVPVAVTGLYQCYGRHLRLPRPGRVRIAYCPPIVLDPGALADRDARRTLAATLARSTREAIIARRAATLPGGQNGTDERRPQSS